MSAYKKHDRVLVATPWSGQAFQRFYITGIGNLTVRGVWETGELAGREATIEKASFRVTEVLR